MAIVDIIEQQLKKSEEHDLAKRKLKEFEEGESGMLLKSLRKKRKTLDEEDKQEMRRLEKELEELKRDKNKWEDQVIYLQNKLTDNMNKEQALNRPVIDNTSEFCQKIAIPFDYLPNFEELTSALFQPFNLRIPLSTPIYQKCEIACQTFSISEYFIDREIFQKVHVSSGPILFPEEIYLSCNIALQGVETGSSEFSRICDWDLLLRNPTAICRNHFKSKYAWNADRNKNDSSVTLAGLRSDYWERLNNVLVFKGEEKPTNDGLEAAKLELCQKMKAWNRCLYGDLKYIFAYAAGGFYLQFYVIDPSFKLYIISDIYDLKNLRDRVKVLINIFNIHRIIRSMEPLLPYATVPVWSHFKRTYGDIFIADTEIEKRIFFFSKYSYSNITVLTNIYENTRNIQSLVHAVKDPSVINDTYKVTLAPVGVRWIPRTELELKVVIRNILDALVGLHELGYVHRDIRWPNILRLNDYSWILIDLECAGVSGERVHFKPLEGWAPETNETGVYTTKADVYMVGRLLSKLFFSLSEEAREFEKATTTNLKFCLTAQEARQHPWLSDIQE